MTPQEQSTNRVPTESWDPYDVWLKRVKQPRERAPRTADVVARTETSNDTHADDARLRGGRLLPGMP